jgi:hypothetical protein
MVLAALTATGLGLAWAPAARAQYDFYYNNPPVGAIQWVYLNPGATYAPSSYSFSYTRFTRGTPVFGPAYTATYPYMYRNNNPSFSPGYHSSPGSTTVYRGVRRY